MRVRAVRSLILCFAAACGGDLQLSPVRQAPLIAIDAPDTVRAGAALAVSVRYWIGACSSIKRLEHQQFGRLITVAVLVLDDPLPPGTGCPDIVYEREASLTISSPPEGQVLIRGALTQDPPVERLVFVERR